VSTVRFLDTNILLYSISTDPGESAKRDIAIALLERDDCGLSVQVLQEFYVQATRPTRSDPLPHEIAVGLIDTWTRFPIQATTLAIVDGAFEIKATHRFSYWDCAIIAAARALGCQELCSEDLAHGREIEGIRIVNPFHRINTINRSRVLKK
jgi:predicted nucleic acid-binding protein